MSIAAKQSHKQGRLRPAACEDVELVLAARAGNQAAFAELWRRHYEIAISLTRPLAPDDADDIVAEAFATIWDKLQHGSGPTEHFRAYLISTCRNMAARTYRDRQRTVTVAEVEDDVPGGNLDLVSGAAEVVSRSESHHTVTQAFSLLPDRWQQVIWWQEVDEIPRTEVAHRLGLSPNSVSALTRRAKEGLRIEWLRLQLPRKDGGEHDAVIEQLPKYLRGSLPRKDFHEIRSHLKGCKRCYGLEEELRSQNRMLGKQLVMGGALATFLVAGVTGAGSAGMVAAAGAAAGTAATSPASVLLVGQRGIHTALARGRDALVSAKMTSVPVMAVTAASAAAVIAVAIGVPLLTPGQEAGPSEVQTSSPSETSRPQPTEAETTPTAKPQASANDTQPAAETPTGPGSVLGTGTGTGTGTGAPAVLPPPVTPPPVEPPPPIDPPPTDPPPASIGLTVNIVSTQPLQLAGSATAGSYVRVMIGMQSMLVLTDAQLNWFADLSQLGLAPGTHQAVISEHVGMSLTDSITLTLEVT